MVENQQTSKQAGKQTQTIHVWNSIYIYIPCMTPIQVAIHYMDALGKDMLISGSHDSCEKTGVG